VHVAVLGAGVTGVTTAYYLALAGHQVTIIEADPTAAAGASSDNGAQLSYSYVAPLADPSMWRHLPHYLFDRDSPLTFVPRPDPQQWAWLTRFLLACRRSVATDTTALLLELARYSRRCLDQLRDDLGLDFNFRVAGKLVMLSTPAAAAAAQRQLELQARLGCRQRLVSREEAVSIEPALAAAASRWVAGVYTADEEVGDCATFSRQLLATTLSRHPRTMALLGTEAGAAQLRAGRVASIDTTRGPVNADAYVICLGWRSARWARPLGLRLPIYPLHGHSITVPVDGAGSAAPQVSVTDASRKTVFARLGERLRVAARLDISGDSPVAPAARRQELLELTAATFPGVRMPADVAGWTGARPSTPTGRPLLGRTAIDNVYLNTGHGMLGWTLACGSARLLADLITHGTTDLELPAYAPDRV
jgi:D-amino-acid dehydrogenase